MNEFMDFLQDVTVLSGLDAGSSYFQKIVDKTDSDKTVYVAHYCVLRFTWMRFGLGKVPLRYEWTIYVVHSSVK